MAILPVSAAELNKKNNINFGKRRREIEEEYISSPKSSNIAKKVPIMVLMAMNPTLLNSQATLPAMAEENPDMIEVVAKPHYKNLDLSGIAEFEQTQNKQNNYPYGWAYFRNSRILYEKKAKGNEAPYTMVYSANKLSGQNQVYHVHLIEDGAGGSNRATDHPPEITKIIYHDLGDADEYCGAYVYEDIADKTGNKHIGTMWSEIRLDHNSAQDLINLITNHTKWENKTGIKFERTTNPNVIPPKLIKSEY